MKSKLHKVETALLPCAHINFNVIIAEFLVYTLTKLSIFSHVITSSSQINNIYIDT
jgi:hypothetical protein